MNTYLTANQPNSHIQLDSRNSSTRRRGVSGRLAHPHQVQRGPECRLAYPHFLDRLLCLRPFLLSFPFFSLLRSWLLWLPLFLLGCFSSYPGGSNAGRLRPLSNISLLDSCSSRLPAYTCVYMRMPAYTCVYLRMPAYISVYLRLHAYDLFLTHLLFTFRSTQ